jgi:predicted CXXCH cytochrome family protein
MKRNAMSRRAAVLPPWPHVWAAIALGLAVTAGAVRAREQVPGQTPAPGAQGAPPAPAAPVTPAAPAAPAEIPAGITDCLVCHEDKEMTLALDDGATMSLFVDLQAFRQSVHGSQLVCTDCHAKYDQDHPSGRTFPSRRAYELGAYETCRKCHFDTYTRTLESVHYELLKSGRTGAPICSDCHGSHDISNPHAKRAMMSKSCAVCHASVYETYRKSVHGRALTEHDNQDVPACADCHTHHQIAQPGTTAFRLQSPDICISCHRDEPMMERYGISTTVAQSYLSDFHGITASLTSHAPAGQQQVVVTCVDCHGMHDIGSPKQIGTAAMQATVTNTCQRCHQDAAPAFSAAWLSHYPPSPDRAPLVWLVTLFYRIFIPFVVIGLVLHLLLHVYRMSAGR